MGTIQDFLRGFRRGFATADPLPRVPVACAVVVFLAGIAAAAAGDPAVGVLCGILAATFVEVAVLRREVRRARDSADRWAALARLPMPESEYLRVQDAEIARLALDYLEARYVVISGTREARVALMDAVERRFRLPSRYDEATDALHAAIDRARGGY